MGGGDGGVGAFDFPRQGVARVPLLDHRSQCLAELRRFPIETVCQQMQSLAAMGRLDLDTGLPGPETRALLRAVHAPLRIRAFLAPHGGAADDARFLLSRYREINSRIRFFLSLHLR